MNQFERETFGVHAGNIFLSISQGIYESTDSGATWQLVSDSLGKAGFLEANGPHLVAGTGYGVFISDDSGHTWKSRNTGLCGTSVGAMCLHDDKLFAAPNYGVSVTSDQGNTWTDLSPQFPIQQPVVQLAATDDALFSATEYPDHDYVSTNDGASWDSISLPDGGGGMVTIGNDLYLSSFDSMYHTSDDGAHWMTLGKSGLPRFGAGLLLVSDIGMYADADVAVGEVTELFRSTDKGLNWSLVDSSELPMALTFYGGSLFASMIAGNYYESPPVRVSKDGGSTWLPDSGYGHYIPYTRLLDSVYAPFAYPTGFAVIGGYLVAMTSGNLYMTRDTGRSWQEVDHGLPLSLGLKSLQNIDDTLFVGTDGAGVWYCPLPELLALSAVRPSRQAASSIDAYPNPFTSSSTIRFATAESERAEITIENIFGNQVAHLFSGELGAGEHSFTWRKPAGLPEGVYECVVRMNGQAETVPLVAIR